MNVVKTKKDTSELLTREVCNPNELNNIYSKKCGNNKEQLNTEEQNREDLYNNPTQNEFLYPILDDPNFNIKISLKKELEKTKNELIETKEHLKKYTAPIRNKIYYEENKEKHKQKVKEYKEKINYNATLTPDKKKEYARKAYLNKKEKLKKINENIEFENI